MRRFLASYVMVSFGGVAGSYTTKSAIFGHGAGESANHSVLRRGRAMHDFSLKSGRTRRIHLPGRQQQTAPVATNRAPASRERKRTPRTSSAGSLSTPRPPPHPRQRATYRQDQKIAAERASWSLAGRALRGWRPPATSAPRDRRSSSLWPMGTRPSAGGFCRCWCCIVAVVWLLR